MTTASPTSSRPRTAVRVPHGMFQSQLDESSAGHYVTAAQGEAAGTLATIVSGRSAGGGRDPGSLGGWGGPSWVASLVNAVEGSKFWDSTAIFVQWDDWGGLYDHVPPPNRGYDGLGFRVPLLVISPYAKKNYVSHVQYETASVLRFAEDIFGLGRLAAADRRAKSPAADCSTAPLKRQYFINEEPDDRIPDAQ